jgi:hypothetical protein
MHGDRRNPRHPNLSTALSIPVALVELQRRCNVSSADRWDLFREHRKHVTTTALEAGGDTLAILGAGNCNDLELGTLTSHFREVHLVDLDREALLRARAAQPAHVARRLVLHAPVDLSGIFGRLVSLRGGRASDEELAILPTAILENVLHALAARFDTVVSSCLLSQLIHGCTVALGSEHPDVPILSCALTLAHARCVASLVAPGGTGVIITDMASSNEHFRLESVASVDLKELATELERAHRCASGTGPDFLWRVLTDDGLITPLLAAPPRPLVPWLWRFGKELTYLVHGVTFRLRAA